MFWQTVFNILLGVLKLIATGVASFIILVVIGVFIAWRVFKRYKRRDIKQDSVVIKQIEEVFRHSDSLQSLTAEIGDMTFEFKKDSKIKKIDIVYPHYWPKVIKGKPFKVILIVELENGEIIEITFLAYWIAVDLTEKPELRGKELYFEYNLVPDQFEKSKKPRFPMDSFSVEEGQILGWIGECNDFFVLMAKLLYIFGLRINVLNNKFPVYSPATGIINGKYVNDLEEVEEGENLFSVLYEPPKDQVEKKSQA